jgi:2-amino-4-hydroxy-6-hydroxymethyldihydropteridine diphosphokinase
MGVIAFIGMGSNLGDRAATIGAAIDALDAVEGIGVLRTSSLHESSPVGGPAGQGPYLNAAVKVETTLPPRELLGVLQGIERDSGRVRAERWGERTLDLDLLLHGDSVIDEPGLVVPHPRMVVRRFVLAPLAEVSPGLLLALNARSIGGLLHDLDRRPGGVMLHGPDPDGAIAAGVVAGLDALDVTKETIAEDHMNFFKNKRDRWIVCTRKGLRAAAAASEAFPSDRWHWYPNFSATWGPGAEERLSADIRERLRTSGVGRQMLRIRAPEGGVATRDWIVSEILAACAASRVTTRVVGSP